MRVSDKTALWVGRASLATIVLVCLSGVALMLARDDTPRVAHDGTFAVVGFIVVAVAWSLAHFTMVEHQHQAPYLTAGDVREWDAREDSRLGALIPFFYLLAGPKERRILQYLNQRRHRRHSSRD